MKLPQQLSFSQAEYASKKKQTRRDRFLAEMDQLVPWERLLAVIVPHYGKPAVERKSRAGRPQIALDRVLEQGFSAVEAAARLNMNQGTLVYWVTQARKAGKISFAQAGMPSASDLMAEVRQFA